MVLFTLHSNQAKVLSRTMGTPDLPSMNFASLNLSMSLPLLYPNNWIKLPLDSFSSTETEKTPLVLMYSLVKLSLLQQMANWAGSAVTWKKVLETKPLYLSLIFELTMYKP